MQQSTPQCPLCQAPADVAHKNFNRAIYFQCQQGHRLLVRQEAIGKLSTLPSSELSAIGAEAMKRTDGFVVLVTLKADLINRSLVPLAEWDK